MGQEARPAGAAAAGGLKKRLTGAQVIAQPLKRSLSKQRLLRSVCRKSRLMIHLTGARRGHALVAVSTGLLQKINRGEIEAVLGHEVSHVANGDMLTLALIQGEVNTFVIFLSRVTDTGGAQLAGRN